MSVITHTVVRGDTLSAISKTYGVSVESIAALNNIKNTSLIYIGQILTIKGQSSSNNTGMSEMYSRSSNSANIVAFGLQADADRLMFAVWMWPKSNTDHYMVEWSYWTNDGRWFSGNNTTVDIPESTYSPPSNATWVRFRVKPVAKNYKDKNDNDVAYWWASWTGYKQYNLGDAPPGVPATPTVEVDKYKMTITNTNLDINATEINYEIIANDKTVHRNQNVPISKGTSIYALNIYSGHKYKVRARGKRGNIYGAWSTYTENYSTIPDAPSTITILKALTETSIQLGWSVAANVKSYSIEYAEKEEYLGNSNGSTTIDNIENNSYILTGLEPGKRYCFRIKAVNDIGASGWSQIKSIVLGTKPEAPSTWSDRNVAMIGDKVLLCWSHNSVDGSDQTVSQIEFEVNGKTDVHQIGLGADGKPINEFLMPTFMHLDSTKIYWRVRTRGVLAEYSEWSTRRMIEVYAPPTLSLRLVDMNNVDVDVIRSFPFSIIATASPNTQKAIVYSLIIKAKDSYITTTPFGEVNINAGDEIYNEIFTSNEWLNVKMHSGIIDLENGINYEIICAVTMNTGLTVTDNKLFIVDWVDTYYNPNAEVLIDRDRLSASIKPYCESYADVFKVVNNVSGKYIESDVEISGIPNGVSVDNAITNTNRVVYKTSDNKLFCIIQNGKTVAAENVTLDVYRRTYDGKYVEIASGLSGVNTAFVTDPHPSLDYARYRISASDNNTGTISYVDIASVDINENSIVIQWDDVWNSFESDGTNTEDILYTSGSMLKLPYNINISENNTPDTVSINYIGREHPVSYYGTALGVKSTWSAVFKKDDKETLHTIRRLSVYMGDVYVREPSGIGYWANINVSYDKSFDSLVIPVTFDIIRVEGGV